MLTKIYIFFILFLFSMWFQGKDERKEVDYEHKKKYIDYQKLKKQIETKTKYFDPAFFKKRHICVIYKIEDYEIKNPAKRQKLVWKAKVGSMPSMRAGGSFKVIYQNESDSTLGSYFMNSPLYYIVESGNQKGFFRVKSGYFEVPIPYDKEIKKIILTDKADILITSNISL